MTLLAGMRAAKWLVEEKGALAVLVAQHGPPEGLA
jgi:hypothetical protein